MLLFVQEEKSESSFRFSNLLMISSALSALTLSLINPLQKWMIGIESNTSEEISSVPGMRALMLPHPHWMRFVYVYRFLGLLEQVMNLLFHLFSIFFFFGYFLFAEMSFWSLVFYLFWAVDLLVWWMVNLNCDNEFRKLSVLMNLLGYNKFYCALMNGIS